MPFSMPTAPKLLTFRRERFFHLYDQVGFFEYSIGIGVYSCASRSVLIVANAGSLPGAALDRHPMSPRSQFKDHRRNKPYAVFIRLYFLGNADEHACLSTSNPNWHQRLAAERCSPVSICLKTRENLAFACASSASSKTSGVPRSGWMNSVSKVARSISSSSPGASSSSGKRGPSLSSTRMRSAQPSRAAGGLISSTPTARTSLRSSASSLSRCDSEVF